MGSEANLWQELTCALPGSDEHLDSILLQVKYVLIKDYNDRDC